MNMTTQQFHEFLTQRIDLSKYTQVEIAKMLGYTKPNIISMFKQGLTKVPVEKIPVFARILNVDPTYALRMAMSEYMPGTLQAVEDHIGSLNSEGEKKLLERIRGKLSNGRDIGDAIYKDTVDNFINSLGQ